MTTTTEDVAGEFWLAFGFRRTQPDATLINRIYTFYEARFPGIGAAAATRFVAAKLNFEALCAEHLKQYGTTEVLLAAAEELDGARQALHDLHAGAAVTGSQLITATAFCKARAAAHAGLFTTHTGGKPFLKVVQAH